MFFETWWQGLVFGVISTVGMLAVAYALMSMWNQKYGEIQKGSCHSCNGHSDH
jgi:hypothetical protein